METATMGKVIVSAKIENVDDLIQLNMGKIQPDAVRSVEVTDAVVDTGARYLCLPKRTIESLGLTPFQTRLAQTSAGPVPCTIYGVVRLTVQGRECNVDVAEVDETCPVLIGYFPLELLDFVVDPGNRRLIGNPLHHGEHIIDLL